MCLLQQKHYRFRSPASASTAPVGCYPLWKGILSTASPFHVSVCFSLGNGALAAFWSTRWNGDSTLRNLFPNLYMGARCKNLFVKCWIRRFATRNNLSFGQSLNWVEQNELGQIRHLIEGATLNDDLDSISWRWCSNGKFTVSSAYNFITFDGVNDRKISHLWSTRIPLRIKLFMWLAGRNRLLTADFLAKRGWHGPSICALCGADAENLDHLLFRCHFARAMWDRLFQFFQTIGQRFGVDTGSLASRWRRARMALPGLVQGTFDIWFAAACWELWNDRNRRIFNNSIKSSDECGRRVGSTARLWISALGV